MADKTNQPHSDPDAINHEAFIPSTANPIWLSDDFAAKCRYALEHAGLTLNRFEVNPDASMVDFAGWAPFVDVQDGVCAINHQIGLACLDADGVLEPQGIGNSSGFVAKPAPPPDPDDLNPMDFINAVPPFAEPAPIAPAGSNRVSQQTTV